MNKQGLQFARKYPLFLSWLLSYAILPVLLQLLKFLLPYVSPSPHIDLQTESDTMIFNIVAIILSIVISLLISFFAFTVSIKNVVFPLCQKNKVISSEFKQVKLSDYLLNWLSQVLYLALFCVPLIC
jgi:hypothetical protein